MEYDGVHVGCYIAYCKRAKIHVRPADYFGLMRRMVFAGQVFPAQKPRCWISTEGEEGSWEELVFPAASGSGLYSVELPGEAAIASEFWLLLDTEKTGNKDGFSFSGWALATDEDGLNGYERWALALYGSLERNGPSDPHRLVEGGRTNLETYAFNLPPHKLGLISGVPSKLSFGPSDGEFVELEVVRVKDLSAGGVRYVIEHSLDGEVWSSRELVDLETSVLEEDENYCRVKVQVPIDGGDAQGIFRVGLHLLSADL